MKKKIPLPVLLSLAFCLSACAPAASAPQSEAPAQATAEAATAQATAETALVQGTLCNIEDCENTGKALYQWQVEAQADGTTLGNLVELDYATAQQRRVLDTGMPSYRLGSCFARGNTIYYTTFEEDGRTLHSIDRASGTEKTMPVVDGYGVGFIDDRALYLFVQRSWGYASMQRVDLETGTAQTIPMPAQTIRVCDGAEGRFLITRLIGEVSLSSLQDEEQRAAALQTATAEYAWWDPDDGSVEPLFQEPYTGELAQSGWPRERVYLGKADGMFYFYRAEWTETTQENCRVERCAPDGSGAETVLTMEDGQGLPGVLRSEGEIRWLVQGSGNGVVVYQPADGSTRHVENPSGGDTPWPLALTDDGRLLLYNFYAAHPEDSIYCLVRQEDYLASNFTGTNVAPVTKETGEV